MLTRGVGRRGHADKNKRAVALLGALTLIGIAVNAMIILADRNL